MPIFPASDENLRHAAKRLQNGELVAFPTETVYGLGAHARDEAAVAQIFAAKGRPATNPLIVHVHNLEAAREIGNWNERAQRLAQRFWPGALTLVLPKKPAIPSNVSAGLETVGVRVPAHPVALKLLEIAQIPVAAPSANRSNHISPTRAHHVENSLGEEIWILDGGPCEIGIESTVLDLSGETPTILRLGGVSQTEIEAEIGPVRVQTHDEAAQNSGAKSPGMSRKHYAPRAKVHVFNTPIDAIFHAMALGWGEKVGVLSLIETEIAGVQDAVSVVMPNDAPSYAARFYDALHQLDDAGCALILIEDVPLSREWNAVRDRILRAAA